MNDNLHTDSMVNEKPATATHMKRGPKLHLQLNDLEYPPAENSELPQYPVPE